MLSHFHADHYDGWLKYPQRLYYWCLDNFYFPKMPQFAEARQFELCLYAMNTRIYLPKTVPIQVSLFEIIRILNDRPLNFINVSKGDYFTCGDSKYEVLWPPKILNDKEILSSIKHAIEIFNIAKEEDERLRKIYENLERTSIYVNNENRMIDVPGYNQKEFKDYIKKILSELRENGVEEEYSEAIKTANNALRTAANHLSIAFRQEDNVLSFGDLESNEINKVTKDLIDNTNTHYDVIIAAHHGRHWHDGLRGLSCDLCLASVGERGINNIEDGYKSISKKFITTANYGDIKICMGARVCHSEAHCCCC